MGTDMGSEMQESIQTRAIEWHIRLRHGDDATWDAFANWLAADPRHGRAYDLIEQTDLTIEPLLPELVIRGAANDSEAADHAPAIHPKHRWWLPGSLLAASIAAALLIAPRFASERYEAVTGPGERQMVTLNADTRIFLNGSTRMVLDRENPRYALLVAGEALFQVHHDGKKPFTLEVGENRVQNVGTVFNVVHESGETRVAVAEGKILFNPDREAVFLQAGQALIDPPSREAVRVTRMPIEAIGAWQKGQLIYSGEPLSQVAADLARSLGIRITVSPSIANRPFSGSINLDGTGPEQLNRLKPALNVDLIAGPDGWTMKPLTNEKY